MDKKIIEKAYFHISNGGYTIEVKEDNYDRTIGIELSSFGKTLYNEFTLSKDMWLWLREVFNRIEPLETDHHEPVDKPTHIIKDGVKIDG